MRKVLALIVAATLLFVSSVPAFAEAVRCAGPAQAVEMMDGEHAGHHHDEAIEESDQGHDHSSALKGDWQKDRIECGCGCHRSVESLPHLLAPHMIDIALFQVEVTSVVASIRSEPALAIEALRIPVPPPQRIS